MQAVRSRLTYANVIATIALFLALSGGVVWAAGNIGTRRLKPNAVTAGKIKKNAVTAVKIRSNAVTGAKIKDGAVSLDKIASGANVVAEATGGPVAANQKDPIPVTLSGTATFTPETKVVSLLSVEAKGNSLARTGAEPCTPTIETYVNGNLFETGGQLTLRAVAPTAEEPSGLRPVGGVTAPLGLTSPGVAQTVSVKVRGDTDCTSASTVTVGVAVTQAK
jgi:hypothetical protein